MPSIIPFINRVQVFRRVTEWQVDEDQGERLTYVCCQCHGRFTGALTGAWDERLYCVWHGPKEAQWTQWRKMSALTSKDNPLSLFGMNKTTATAWVDRFNAVWQSGSAWAEPGGNVDDWYVWCAQAGSAKGRPLNSEADYCADFCAIVDRDPYRYAW